MNLLSNGLSENDRTVRKGCEPMKKDYMTDIYEEELDLTGGDELGIGSVAQTRPAVTVFVLADTSRSMIIDGNINKLNSAIHELRPQLLRLQGADVQVSLAIYTFGGECGWKTLNDQGEPDAVPVEEFVWSDVRPSGQTPLGKALSELNLRLSRKGFIRRGMVYYAPIVLLITDDMPTDDWQDPMKKLQNNAWFCEAIRIAIGPEEGRASVLSEFTGSEESVIEFPRSGEGSKLSDRLSAMIVKIVVSASRVASQTRSVSAVDHPERPVNTAVDIAKQVVRDAMMDIEEQELDLSDDTGFVGEDEGFGDDDKYF